MPLSRVQREHWLRMLITTPRYGKFLEFAKRSDVQIAESVEFLHEFCKVPWNGNTPIGVVNDQTIHDLYVEGLGADHMKLNLWEQEHKVPIRDALGKRPVDWGPAVRFIIDMLVNNAQIDRYVEQLLASRE